jgi:hypothetical protein
VIKVSHALVLQKSINRAQNDPDKQNQLVLSPSFSSQSLSSNNPLNITRYYNIVLLLHHTTDYIGTPLLIVHSALS